VGGKHKDLVDQLAQSWIQAVREFAQPFQVTTTPHTTTPSFLTFLIYDQAGNLRVAAAESLSGCLATIPPDDSYPPWIGSGWIAVLGLLQDEDGDVRGEMCKLVANFLKLHSAPRATKAQFLLMSKLNEANLHPSYLDFLLDTLYTPLPPAEDEGDGNNRPLFEKEEDNTWEEPIYSAQLASYHLAKLIAAGRVPESRISRLLEARGQLFAQLQQSLAECQNPPTNPFWTPFTSYHPSVFLKLHREIFGLLPLLSLEPRVRCPFHFTGLHPLLSQSLNALCDFHSLDECSVEHIFFLFDSTPV
jgi:hypothetical protein